MEILVMWRCTVPAEKARAFLDNFEEETITPRRSSGEKGNLFSNVDVADEEHEIAMRTTLAFLQRNAAKLRQLVELGGSSKIDVGVLVGSESSYAPTVTFTPLLLSELAQLGIGLCVSAYPSSGSPE